MSATHDVVSVGAQVAALAWRYSQRAETYDRLWSPAIQPVGELLLRQLPLADAARIVDVGTGSGALLPAIKSAAPAATILGIDNSEGMLELARRRHDGPLALMNAEELDLPDDHVDVAVIAFVLFHLPHPERSLAEVCRILTPGGSVGTATWGAERFPLANAVWDEELTAAGAASLALPATDNRGSCNSESKIAALLESAGFASIKTRTVPLEHRWTSEAHHEYQQRNTSRFRLESLDNKSRLRCLQRISERLAGASTEDYVYRGDVVLATAVKPSRRTQPR